jgi:hypothetical protein
MLTQQVCLLKGKEGKNMKGERENKERRKQPK